MKRFIRYLYEYENEKRIRNVGFVKVEAGCEETIVHMQAKGFHNREERKLVLYLFFENGEEIVVIQKDEMQLESPALSWHFVFSVNDVGGEKTYSKICGVLIETENGRRMAATWDDRNIDISHMKEYVEEAVTSEVCEIEEEKDGQELSEEVIYTQQQSKKVTKITRQDISKLPRCEWKLANNQFLIHGYNNFHHLLLIDDGNHLKLGVPGIYHIKEAKCADTFGFEEFLSADELGISCELEESQDELFGYWCRMVRSGRHEQRE